MNALHGRRELLPLPLHLAHVLREAGEVVEDDVKVMAAVGLGDQAQLGSRGIRVLHGFPDVGDDQEARVLAQHLQQAYARRKDDAILGRNPPIAPT